MAGRVIFALCLFSLSNSQPLKLFDWSDGSADYLNQQILKASFGQVPSAEHWKPPSVVRELVFCFLLALTLLK